LSQALIKELLKAQFLDFVGDDDFVINLRCHNDTFSNWATIQPSPLMTRLSTAFVTHFRLSDIHLCASWRWIKKITIFSMLNIFSILNTFVFSSV
jgi:hypothetical protein